MNRVTDFSCSATELSKCSSYATASASYSQHYWLTNSVIGEKLGFLWYELAEPTELPLMKHV